MKLRLGLVSKEFRNNDLDFNMNQIKETIFEYRDQKIDFLCFGEAFLQGFDAFKWKFEHDFEVALARKSGKIDELKMLARNNKIGLALGYLEKEGSFLYSSYIFIDKDGNDIYNYRRYSSGWKEDIADSRKYLEGKEIGLFEYNDKKILIGLCGDFWDYRYDYIENSSKIEKDFVIWPIYVNFSLVEWENEIHEYAKQAHMIGDKVLMINSISKEPKSHGGSFAFINGTVENKIIFDLENVLIIEI
ncbi:MAG: hypothetical protein K0Q49_2174 [Haloplasmataceae bacterium]|nr:hypothetical protein [Haloplasmataceae bacterium]